MNKNQLGNWNTVNGYGSLRWGNPIGGVVKSKEIWTNEIPTGLCLGTVVVQSDVCYAYADNHLIYSIQLDSGKVEWNCKIPDDRMSVFSINATESYLVVETHVVRTDTAQISADLRNYTDGFSIKPGTPIEVVGSTVYKAISGKEAPGKILKFNLETKESEILDTGLIFLVMPDESSILGWKEYDGHHRLSRYSIPDNKTECINNEIALGRLLLEGDELLIMNTDEATLFDTHYNQVVWKRDLAEMVKPIDPQFAMQYRLSMCDDMIYIAQVDNLIAVDRKTGDVTWKTNLDDLGETCIVGDLIYSFYERGILIALDRYTGEIIWSHEGAALWNSVKANGNKVIYIAPAGVMVCYAWDENNLYHSPAKPK